MQFFLNSKINDKFLNCKTVRMLNFTKIQNHVEKSGLIISLFVTLIITINLRLLSLISTEIQSFEFQPSAKTHLLLALNMNYFLCCKVLKLKLLTLSKHCDHSSSQFGRVRMSHVD